jgi:N6-L-threonylcarbamoyladenine synthase
MRLLALETSCDETSAAVIQNGWIVSNIISSQIALHAEYGGVVPELAAREHLRNLLPVVRAALQAAQTPVETLEAIAVTRGPGLPNALMTGFKAAQAMAFVLNKPLIGVNHHEAHLYSAWITGDPPHADFSTLEPSVSLIVSGGHTLLVHVRGELDHVVLGSTVDDAAGECFDKIAKMIGLPYPGGPEIDRLAAKGNRNAYDFPRPMIHDTRDDFSFSGLKTSVRYFLRDHPEIMNDRARLFDLCASAQAAIVDTLVAKTLQAARRLNVRSVTVSGGVSCNRGLRADLDRACKKEGITLRLASGSFCTDNAAMIGVLAERKCLKGIAPTPLDADVLPGWAL